jgi:glutamine phosphoribosylpyrophosphate amidotransferase
MVTDDSVVDGLLASTLVDVAWMAEAVNVHHRIRVPGFACRGLIWHTNYGLIMTRRSWLGIVSRA